MWRNEMMHRITKADGPVDVVVIGGGATGVGIAVDAASRGYSTVLLERDDFAKGTSSRSTKLVHGGVRYLAQGNVRLVLEALRERGIMRKNAPALVRDLPFVVPAYQWWEIPFYYIGLKLYDLLSGKRSLGRSTYISSSSVEKFLPTIRKKGLKGGIVYYDGQFDDSRMAVSLAKTAEEHGAAVLNYAEVNQIDKDEKADVFHLKFKDHISDQEIALSAKTVFNATGVYVDDILGMEQEQTRPLIAPSRGAHIVVDGRFLKSRHGIMIPKTSDGRVLFAIPWYDKTLIGTTDAPVEETNKEPQPSDQEINFILETADAYMTPSPKASDIQSVFAGLRPLAAPEESGHKTKEISRGHRVLTSPHGMITIIGGKWTTYRRMAEDAVDEAIKLGRLSEKTCRTDHLPVWVSALDKKYGLGEEGNAEVKVESKVEGNEIVVGYPWTAGDVRYMIREEYALTIEDILSRRMRLLVLDADRALKIAPEIGAMLQEELGSEVYDLKADLDAFKALAKKYRWKSL
ncbi:FAD-dependent oxidoreductase [Membranicola marinus]|uniref:Glycerol-3-phosphate dehydrogenase n=1 Tax=Membranihabitans marinus TaxID=1227546 RepID=A0A953HN19_9BACT|nr:FAD-dependent oxidoreductase [Membranihabitans marinus]MBY5957533.1 FAD-dependent oxidoreductase [Membranihabitans marinus]